MLSTFQTLTNSKFRDPIAIEEHDEFQTSIDSCGETSMKLHQIDKNRAQLTHLVSHCESKHPMCRNNQRIATIKEEDKREEKKNHNNS